MSPSRSHSPPPPPSTSSPTLLQSLASSSLPRRRAAMRRLRSYLTWRGAALTGLECRKVWKGLFYCLYMTPKPLLQQRLSIEISELAAVLLRGAAGRGEQEEEAEGKMEEGLCDLRLAGNGRRRKRKRGSEGEEEEEEEEGERGQGLEGEEEEDNKVPFLRFLRAFWVVIGMEWEGIDKARLDKFLFLVRRMVRVGFEGCKVTKLATRTTTEQQQEADEEGDATATRRKGEKSDGRGDKTDGSGGAEADGSADAEREQDGSERDYDWDGDLLEGHVGILRDLPLTAQGYQKTPTGLALHTIDVLVDELAAADPRRTVDLETVLSPLRDLARRSVVKTVRKRAGEALGEAVLAEWGGGSGVGGSLQGPFDDGGAEGDGGSEDDFQGFD